MINIYVCIFTTLLTFTYCQDYSCYDFRFEPRVCLPGPENIASRRQFFVTPNMTCGNPPSGYCRSMKPSGCFFCNASSVTHQHSISYLTDQDFPMVTWWQSITWWDATQRSLLVDSSLKVQLVLSMNKTYDVSGSIKIAFHSSRPNAFSLEKSSDYGKTWSFYRFYADNCARRFPQIQSISTIQNPNDVYCVEDSNLKPAGGSQIVFKPYFTAENFWSKEIQTYLVATDIRISLEYPWTDGYEIIKQELFLNKYFYDISDIQIHARCHCNGHAPYCYGSDVNEQQCFCQHNTFGKDCEKCLPLFNNKPWKPAESTQKPNACEACQCYNHSLSCLYNETLGFGVCDNCLHGTTGDYCQQCQQGYYRNNNVSITDVQTCLACDCYPDGIVNNGSCLQSDALNAGQCFCKANVIGRHCDQCIDGYFGLSALGDCFECNCSKFGSVINKSRLCNEAFGQCECKQTTTERKCSVCKTGYYSFPNSTVEECNACLCNPGGSYGLACDNLTGQCSCRDGIIGKQCANLSLGRFFPSFQHYLFDVVFAKKSSEILAVRKNNSYEETYFAVINSNEILVFDIVLNVSNRYFLVYRYNTTPESAVLYTQLTYTNNTVTYLLFNESSLIEKNSSVIQRNITLVMMENIQYTLRVSSNRRVLVNSVVLMPDYKNSQFYQISNSSIKQNIYYCWKNSFEFQKDFDSMNCDDVTFASTIEWFNGSLECDCDVLGSYNLSCKQFGGQCSCKPGVIGRKCDRCKPRYFNLTEDGCQKCSCNLTGSKSMICDHYTGQCHCHDNIIKRTCSQCDDNFYGFGSIAGCQECGCNTSGSLALQCLNDGQCICRSSISGLKCDRCKENYFNFTTAGCSACGCNVKGSVQQQCNLTVGDCSCKENVHGALCSSCNLKHFNLNEENEKGCQECFCFNKTSSCSSAEGFHLQPIPFVSERWAMESDIYLNDTSKCFYWNLSKSQVLFHAPQQYIDSLTALHYQQVVVYFSTFMSSPNRILLRFGDINENATFLLKQVNHSLHMVTLTSENTFEKLFTWQLQKILTNIRQLTVVFDSENESTNSGIFCNITINVPVKKDNSSKFYGVERCSCPENYTGLSCEKCATGFTRETPSLSSWSRCVKCMCNDRSNTCDPDIGTCTNCRLGTTGDFCEKCESNVKEPFCNECVNGTFGFNNTLFVGCKFCDCYSKNTLNGRSDVCDSVSGRCPCKPDIEGRRCDRCAENSVNITNECKECSPCHGLIQNEIHLLRNAINTLQRTVDEKLGTGQKFTSDLEISKLINNMSSIVTNLTTFADYSVHIEEQILRNLSVLDATMNSFQKILTLNMTQSVNYIRDKSLMISLHENASRSAIDLMYRVLWTSVYIAQTDIEPVLNNTALALIKLKELEVNAASMSMYYNKTLTKFLEEVGFLTNRTEQLKRSNKNVESLSQNISVDLNQTKVELTDLSQGMQGTEVLLYKLIGDSIAMMNDTSRVLQSLTLAQENFTSVTNRTHETHAALSNTLGNLFNTSTTINLVLHELNTSHVQTLDLVSRYLNLSSYLRLKVADQVRNSSIIEKQIFHAENNVIKATQMVNETYTMAVEILAVLKNVHEFQPNITVLLNESLEAISKVNKTSQLVMLEIHEIQNKMNISVNTASAAYNFSKKATEEALNLQQLLTTLYTTAKVVLNNSQLQSSNSSTLEELSVNVTSDRRAVTLNHEQCKNMINTTKKLVEMASVKNEVVQRQLTEEKSREKELDDLFVSLQAVDQLDETALRDLETSLQDARLLFDSLSIRNVLSLLRAQSKKQQTDIQYYKQQIIEIRSEAQELRNLQDQMSSTKGCD